MHVLSKCLMSACGVWRTDWLLVPTPVRFQTFTHTGLSTCVLPEPAVSNTFSSIGCFPFKCMSILFRYVHSQFLFLVFSQLSILTLYYMNFIWSSNYHNLFSNFKNKVERNYNVYRASLLLTSYLFYNNTNISLKTYTLQSYLKTLYT